MSKGEIYHDQSGEFNENDKFMTLTKFCQRSTFDRMSKGEIYHDQSGEFNENDKFMTLTKFCQRSTLFCLNKLQRVRCKEGSKFDVACISGPKCWSTM